MKYQAAKDLADSTLAALVAGKVKAGMERPDPTTELRKISYSAPGGGGHAVIVSLLAVLGHTVRIIRHSGTDARYDVPDKSFTALRFEILRAAKVKGAGRKVIELIAAATTMDDLLLAEPPAPTAAPVPARIAAWQAKAALKLTPHPQAGNMLAAAEAALNAMPDGAEKVVALSAWANNANFERTSPTILSFGNVLGMSSADLDNLFRLGGGLAV